MLNGSWRATMALLAALSPFAMGCSGSDGDGSPAGGGSSGSGSGSGGTSMGWGGLLPLVCQQSGDGCTCRPASTPTAKNDTACFADKRLGSESPNVCCQNGSITNASYSAGYECKCALPIPSTWRCFTDAFGCACTGSPDAAAQFAARGQEIAPSSCFSKVNNCAFDKNTQLCNCTDRTDVTFPANGIADCKAAPAGMTLKVCPSGQTRVDACDGQCHPETCFGGAGERCNAYGCTPQTWACVAGLCQKI